MPSQSGEIGFQQTHNLKVIGSNPIPATTETDTPAAASAAGVLVFAPLADKLRSDKGEEARKLWPRKGRHELEAIAAKDHKLGRTV